jgi:hypothetical protein
MSRLSAPNRIASTPTTTSTISGISSGIVMHLLLALAAEAANSRSSA